MSELYRTLGITRTADEAEIKQAYRKLAKKLHPDVNKDDAAIAERFKKVSAAYAILSDAKKRAQYDRGEIDENGQDKAPTSPFNQRGGAGPTHEFDMDDAQDIFSEFFKFSGGRRWSANSGGKSKTKSDGWAGRAGHGQRGLDISYKLIIAFEEAVTGCKRRLTLNDGRDVDISIPAGIKTGQVIRLAGQGGGGLGGGKTGDALVEIEVADHPYYTRDGLDLRLDLPISLDEALLGADVEIPTATGKITVRIPKGASSGQKLRLKGKGISKGGETGHIYATIKVIMPENPTPELVDAVKAWAKASSNKGPNLRRKAGMK